VLLWIASSSVPNLHNTLTIPNHPSPYNRYGVQISSSGEEQCLFKTETKQKQTPWPESVSEMHRPRDRRLSAKLVPNFAEILLFKKLYKQK
jgi:hypothetical protein